VNSPELGRLVHSGLIVALAFSLVVAVVACGKKPAPEPIADPAPPPPPKPRPAKGGSNFDPFAIISGGAPNKDEAAALKKKYEALLVGTWVADLGDGAAEELTYNADGTYSANLTGPEPATAAGKYTVLQAVGKKGLKLRLGEDPGARTVTATFVGDELEHPTLRPGITATFRKKP
jgi:hypothetical protein